MWDRRGNTVPLLHRRLV
ncbi:hypothetical protein ACHAXM_000084 [Skeletonema potamos]